MSILDDIVALAAAIIPPLFLNKEKAREETIARIRRAQDRLLDKRLKLEEELKGIGNGE